ncbi:MAG: hypothetical protein KDD47_10010 [Acidobacteria bacterium]|nr:hypothetical protein [Acidobacteriota bacterium]
MRKRLSAWWTRLGFKTGGSEKSDSSRVGHDKPVHLTRTFGGAGDRRDVGWQDVAYERVHTVSVYYDGPREGVADYGGAPHRYKNEWNNEENDWAETFELTPVDEETFRLEVERWQIWRTWERAFHSGEVEQESHPGHGGKNRRYDELGELIESRMLEPKPLDLRLVANFRALPGQDLPGYMMRELEVEWSFPPGASKERPRER